MTATLKKGSAVDEALGRLELRYAMMAHALLSGKISQETADRDCDLLDKESRVLLGIAFAEEYARGYQAGFAKGIRYEKN